jgi:hypothetical protein
VNADEPVRSSQARAAAELALVRVVHHYGEKPGFVLLGGLVPQLLCSQSAFRHAGTTDVDVQVDLEIAAGATHTRRLERALANAEFRPDSERVWRWELQTDTGRKATVKFELLADLEDQKQGAIITFDDCQQLGAVNLRGTGYAARDVQEQTLRAKDGGILREVQVNVSGLGGFLMAKAAAANGGTSPRTGTTSRTSCCTTTTGPLPEPTPSPWRSGRSPPPRRPGSSNCTPTLLTATAKAPARTWSSLSSTIPTRTHNSWEQTRCLP